MFSPNNFKRENVNFYYVILNDLLIDKLLEYQATQLEFYDPLAQDNITDIMQEIETELIEHDGYIYYQDTVVGRLVTAKEYANLGIAPF